MTHGVLLNEPGERPALEELELERDLVDRRATLWVSHGGDHLPAEDFPLPARLPLDGDLARGKGIRSVVRFP